MAEHQVNTSNLIKSVFQSRIGALSSEAAYKYRKTLADLDNFLTAHSIPLSDINSTAIADWTIELLRQGLSKATIVQRLNILNTLLKAAADKEVIPVMTAPRDIARALEAGTMRLPLLNPTTFEQTLAAQRATAGEEKTTDIYADMLLLATLQRGTSLTALASLTKEDTRQYKGLAAHITGRNADNRRKFIFDIKQSYQTPRQIATEAGQRLRDTFPAITGTTETNASDKKSASLFDALSASLWTAYAMRSGATASQAAASIANANTATPLYTIPTEMTATETVTDEANADDAARTSSIEKAAQTWQQAVETLLSRDLPGWYAMRLRRGVRFEDFRKLLYDRLQAVPELFYPVETIRKHLGGKTKIVEHPFISGIVFFKTHPENILPMFARIGDKAWCIRHTDSAESPYARISQSDMQRFQRAIGHFTADTELHPLGTLIPKPGEKVILIHTDYEGRQAEVEEIVESREDTAIIRVKLTTDFGYEWRINIDARQTEGKVSERG